jgi:hypothetical protein
MLAMERKAPVYTLLAKEAFFCMQKGRISRTSVLLVYFTVFTISECELYCCFLIYYLS